MTSPISRSPLPNVHSSAWTQVRRLLLLPELPTLPHLVIAYPLRAKQALSARIVKAPLHCPRPLPIQTAVFRLARLSRRHRVPCSIRPL
jgi:hypothetical protein